MSTRVATYVFNSETEKDVALNRIRDKMGTSGTSYYGREIHIDTDIQDVSEAVRIIESCGGRKN